MVKLTQKEKDWFARLEKCLAAAPKSLNNKVSSYTIGDNDINIIDPCKLEEYIMENPKAEDYYFCSQVEASGAKLLSLEFPFDIESTAG